MSGNGHTVYVSQIEVGVKIAKACVSLIPVYPTLVYCCHTRVHKVLP
jgi:hypothetical protein